MKATEFRELRSEFTANWQFSYQIQIKLTKQKICLIRPIWFAQMLCRRRTTREAIVRPNSDCLVKSDYKSNITLFRTLAMELAKRPAVNHLQTKRGL